MSRYLYGFELRAAALALEAIEAADKQLEERFGDFNVYIGEVPLMTHDSRMGVLKIIDDLWAYEPDGDA